MISEILYLVFALIISIVLHELGHAVAITALKRKPQFFVDRKGLGFQYNQNGLTVMNQKFITMVGVAAGAMMALLFYNSWLIIVFLVVYLLLCQSDLKSMLKSI